MRWSINEAWMTSGLERKNSIKSVEIGRVTLVEYAIQTMRCSKSESFLTRSQAGQPSDAAVVKDIEIKVRHHPGSNVKETEREKRKTKLNVKSFTLSASASLSLSVNRREDRIKLLFLTSYVAQLNA